MLKNLMNKNIKVYIGSFAITDIHKSEKGLVTNVDNEFVELNGNVLIAVKYIYKIEIL